MTSRRKNECSNTKDGLIRNSKCRKAIGRIKLILSEDWLDDTWLTMKCNGGTDLPPVIAVMAFVDEPRPPTFLYTKWREFHILSNHKI